MKAGRNRAGEAEQEVVWEQHWSMRTPLDRKRSLWGSYAVMGDRLRFWFSGDTGYAPVFKHAPPSSCPPSAAIRYFLASFRLSQRGNSAPIFHARALSHSVSALVRLAPLSPPLCARACVRGEGRGRERWGDGRERGEAFTCASAYLQVPASSLATASVAMWRGYPWLDRERKSEKREKV